MHRLRWLCALLCVAFLCVALESSLPAAAQNAISPPPGPTAVAGKTDIPALHAALAGSWVGVLEYRDYQTDGRVKLPTWATIRAGANGLDWSYVYDDGPGKQVVETFSAAFSGTPQTYTRVSPAKAAGTAPERTVEHVEGLDTLKIGRGTLVLTGTSTENGKPVDTRTTFVIRRNLLQITRETRTAGQAFLFRDGYVLTRLAPLNEPANVH